MGQEVLEEARGFDVWVHIYDLGLLSKWVLNVWVDRKGSPTAGAFHVGVEVCGVELSYQALSDEGPADAEKSGVWAHEPKGNPGYVYRESVFLGRCAMSLAEIQDL